MGKSIGTDSKLVVVRAWEKRGVRMDSNGVAFWGDEYVLELDSGHSCTTI